MWAREEERRRLQAEEMLRKACEAGQASEARNKALEEEVGRGERVVYEEEGMGCFGCLQRRRREVLRRREFFARQIGL